jgi:hypothetical protein
MLDIMIYELMRNRTTLGVIQVVTPYGVEETSALWENLQLLLQGTRYMN